MAHDGVGEQTAEVSTDEGRRGNGAAQRGGCRLTKALIDAEDEGFFSLLIDAGDVQGTAGGTPKLIAVEAGARQVIAVVEVVVGVESAVAIELEYVSVEAVGSGLCDYVDDVTAAPAVLRGEGIGLDLELLDVFDGRNVDNAAPILRGVPGAVQKIG